MVADNVRADGGRRGGAHSLLIGAGQTEPAHLTWRLGLLAIATDVARHVGKVPILGALQLAPTASSDVDTCLQVALPS